MKPAATMAMLHGLLLKERHAHGLASTLFQFGALGSRLGSLPFTPAQIGMHHVALDRPGPHDRDFDDEIVEVSAV